MELLGKCQACGASPPTLGMFLGMGAGPSAIQCRCGGWSSTTLLYRLIWNFFAAWKYLFLGLFVGTRSYGAGWGVAAGGALVIGGLASLLVIPVTVVSDALKRALNAKDEGDEVLARSARETTSPRPLPAIRPPTSPRATEKLVACPYCAGLIPPAADPCPRCGRGLARTKQVLAREVAKCSGCGRPFNPTFAACPFCGKARGPD